jgi:signal transduction histidine kinase
MSFRLRLTLFGAGLVAVTVLAFGWLVYALASNSQATTQDELLKQRAADAIAAIANASPADFGGSATASLASAEDLRLRSDPFTEIYTQAGLLSSSARVASAPPAIPSNVVAEATSGGIFATINLTRTLTVRVFARSWTRPDLGIFGSVVAGQSISAQSTNRKGLLGFLIVSSIPTLLAAFIASWLITGRALRPLQVVAQTAESIAETRDLKRRVPQERRNDEIGLLSQSFNRMLERLEAAYQQLSASLDAQRRFVADASHELRTPLTTIRGNAGLLAQGPSLSDDVRVAAARDIASESERMSRMVEHLLTLAQADAGRHLELGRVALRPLMESVCRQAQAAHPDRNFRSAGITDALVNGDQDALVELLWILVDNAVKFTKPDGCIELGLQQHDSTALLTVADDGGGIPEGDTERIFERFYQADGARSNKGAGLGLSIGRWIVEEHSGTISARNNDGPGATFTVSLPLAN